MKVRIDIDLTPAEARAFFGLPDVQPLQEELFDRIRERMRSGAEGYDPLTLMKPFLTWNLESMEALQKAFTQGNLRRDGDSRDD